MATDLLFCLNFLKTFINNQKYSIKILPFKHVQRMCINLCFWADEVHIRMGARLVALSQVQRGGLCLVDSLFTEYDMHVGIFFQFV